MFNKLQFKKEITDIKGEFKELKERINHIQDLSKIRAIAIDLLCIEISLRTGESKELVKERVIDNAIENYKRD